MTYGNRLSRLEDACTRRRRLVTEREQEAATARAILSERLARCFKAAHEAAQEGRRHYLFAQDKQDHLAAHYPGPFAAWWRKAAEALEAVRKGRPTAGGGGSA